MLISFESMAVSNKVRTAFQTNFSYDDSLSKSYSFSFSNKENIQLHLRRVGIERKTVGYGVVVMGVASL